MDEQSGQTGERRRGRQEREDEPEQTGFGSAGVAAQDSAQDAGDAAVGVYVSNAQAKVSTVATAASVAKEPEIGNIKGVAEVVE